MKRLAGKTCLITGAAAGIGQATAVRLASEGAEVMCVDVSEEGLTETKNLVTDTGAAKVLTRITDVSSPNDTRATVEACISEFGKLDHLSNIAGIMRMSKTHELDLDLWNRILNVNLTGTFLMCQAALRHLLETKGNIVNISSTSALAGMPWGAAYGASKGGVLALTRTLAIEYGKQGLRANAICPGAVSTAMTGAELLPDDIDTTLLTRMMPLKDFAGPESVAGVIAMLASEDGGHINGEHIRVDGATLS